MTITKEGSLASFYTVNKAPIKHLRVYFSPKQAGSGTASPENIRPIEGRSNIYADYTGQNLLPSGTFAVTRRGIDYQYSTDGSIRIQGYDASYTFLSLPSDYQFYIPAGTYTLSCNTSSGITVYMLLDGNDIEFKIGNGKTSITKTIPSGIAKLQVAAYTTVDTTIYPQLEVGSTASSFKKPMIHRSQTIQFPPQTKNLFNPNWDMLNYTSTYTINSDGSITQKQSDGRGWTQSNFPPIHLEAGTYTLTCSDGNTFNVGTSIDNFATQTRLANGGGTFTLAQDADVRIKHSASSYPTTFTAQLEKGSSATSYEPYKGTIYGGYIDLITGELVAQYGFFSTTWGAGLNNTVLGNNERRGFYSPSIIFDTSSNLHADGQGPYQAVKTTMCNAAFWGWDYNSDTTHYYINEHDINVMLPVGTDNNLILNFCAKLKNPQTIATLTPTELQTFLGRNNIWSNADRIEVEYDLAESNDELYRRRNIILQGAPHLETATGNIANFKTDLIAPIKEVKVYFEPIQEGSGTPSLENVREINGWNSTNIQHSSKNMLNPAYYTKGSSYTLNGTTYTYDGNGTVTLNGKSNGESSQVTFSWTQSFDCDYYFCGNCSFDTSVGDVYMWDVTTSARPTKWDGTTKSGASYPSSNLQQVKLLAGHHIQLCVRVYSVSTTELTNATAQPMLLPKTCTNTTFESYNGQTIPITFPTTGKNLYDANTYPLTIGKWIHGSNGRDSESSALAATMGFIPCKNFAGKTVTLNKHLSAEIWNPGVAFYNANKEFISGINNNGSSGSYTTFIVPENASYLRFTVMSDSTNIQLELGSSATTYEPYTNTIYGGYVDLTNGEIVQTHFLFQRRVGDMDNNESYPGWKNCSDFKAIANYIDNTDNGYRYNLICNVGDRIWYNSKSTNPTVFIYLEMKNNMTQTEWKTNYPDLVMKWVLPLAAPIHHPLTPQTLKTLKATNNIWSSANGPVSIKYWTH